MQWNDLIGTYLGPYRILEEIGRGGSGRVYKALEEPDERPVAMKVILNDAEDAEGFVRRFGREVELVERLSHPNIVAVYDSGQRDDLIYLVMRYINGGTLRQRLGRPLPASVACAAMVQMCHALQHAHDAHIVHRDVKPSNMLVALDDDGRLLLTDFGIAKLQGLRGLTKSGTTIGTPEYMAPEQAEGREVDRRSDIYSLGCVLYEALSGQPPFVGTTPVSVLYQQVHIRPEPIRGLNPTVPRELAAVLGRALAKRPHDRFESADAFALALMPFTRTGVLSLAAVPLVRASAVGAATRVPAAPTIEPSSEPFAPPILDIHPSADPATNDTANGTANGSANGALAPVPPSYPGAPGDWRRDDGDELLPDTERDPAATHPGANSGGVRDAVERPWAHASATARGRGMAPRHGLGVPSRVPSHGAARRWVLAGGAVASLVVLATLAWVLVATVNAGFAGRGAGPHTTRPAPTTTSAPTVTTGPQPTATLTAQQLLDKQAVASFRAITLARLTDSDCAAANNRTTFSTAQSIYVNLCLASSATAGSLTIVMRQNGATVRVITRNVPLDARNSTWYTFYTFNVPTGSYDMLITFNGGTAADISITVQ